jgi:hypothetical protein
MRHRKGRKSPSSEKEATDYAIHTVGCPSLTESRREDGVLDRLLSNTAM